MARRNNRTAIPPETEETDRFTPVFSDTEAEPADPDTEFQAVADTMGGDISQKAWAWIEQKNATDLEITATLYKEKKEGGKAQCGKWKNQIPDEHSIGLVHGGGRYSIIVTYPKTAKNPPGVWKREFELDTHYNTLKQEAEMMGQTPALGRVQLPPMFNTAPVSQAPVRNVTSEALELVKAIIPLIQQQQKPDNTLAQMTQMYQMMGFVMKKSLLDQTDFLAQMQERMMDNFMQNNQQSGNAEGEAVNPPVETEKPKTWLEQVLPYIAPFLEKMTSGNPAEKTATAALVNSIPAVQQIMTDPKHAEDCKKLIAYMDKQLKPEKTDEILKALKVDRKMYA
jgi:hypothetical protein